MLDVLLQARDRGLYHAITDCGAGGFSSAVGEMGETIGAVGAARQGAAEVRGPVVHAKSGSPKSQERMVLAVPPDKLGALRTLCASEDVEATVIGTLRADRPAAAVLRGRAGRRPRHGTSCTTAGRRWCGRQPGEPGRAVPPDGAAAKLTGRLARPARPAELQRHPAARSSAAAERVQQGMDHPPVRSRSAGRQRHQAAGRRPRTTAPATPRSSRRCSARGRGLAIGCGINPRYGDLDPYWMAAARDRRGGAQRRRGRRRSGPDRPARQFLLGQHRSARGARLAGARRRGVPRRGAGLQHAVHQRQGQPQQRISRRAAGTSSFRRRCSSARWAACPTCAAA